MAKPAVINIINANIPNEQKSDDSLIVLFQNGEREVFRFLVERYQEKVRNIVFSIFNDPDLVDDISQEVFIKVFLALQNFRFESSFYTWIYRITVNKCRDELRKKKVKRFFSFQSFEKTTNLKINRIEAICYPARVCQPTHRRVIVTNSKFFCDIGNIIELKRIMQ